MIKRGLLSGGYLTGETQAPTALCLAPTRELAVQIHREVCKFANETVVTAAVCYGGVSVHHQADKIRRGCHFLVATPGRLIDFVDSNRVGKIHFYNTVKFRNKPRGLYFSKALCEGLIFTEGSLRFKIDWASLIFGSKFTVFALLYFVFKGTFPSTSPRGAGGGEHIFDGVI